MNKLTITLALLLTGCPVTVNAPVDLTLPSEADAAPQEARALAPVVASPDDQDAGIAPEDASLADASTDADEPDAAELEQDAGFAPSYDLGGNWTVTFRCQDVLVATERWLVLDEGYIPGRDPQPTIRIDHPLAGNAHEVLSLDQGTVLASVTVTSSVTFEGTAAGECPVPLELTGVGE